MFLKSKTTDEPSENMNDTVGYNIDILAGGEIPAGQYSPLTLAFLGDAVYSLLVREHLVRIANRPAGQLHQMSIGCVNAAAQAKAAAVILPLLTEEETAVYKRGRNAHSSHTPKNQANADYHSATGIEALFGFLYLKGSRDRISELFGKIAGELYEQ